MIVDTDTIEDSLEVKQAFSNLKPNLKAILALFHAGYKHTEIAEIIGISRVWVSASIQQAHRMLREFFTSQ